MDAAVLAFTQAHGLSFLRTVSSRVAQLFWTADPWGLLRGGRRWERRPLSIIKSSEHGILVSTIRLFINGNTVLLSHYTCNNLLCATRIPAARLLLAAVGGRSTSEGFGGALFPASQTGEPEPSSRKAAAAAATGRRKDIACCHPQATDARIVRRSGMDIGSCRPGLSSKSTCVSQRQSSFLNRAMNIEYCR